MRRALALAAALVLAAPASAADGEGSASIEDAAWLSGRWVGEGLGGTVEEIWSPPRGGQMVGHFILSRDGVPAMYELMLIDEHEGGLRMRVKHFDPDFTGWEERDAWHTSGPVAVGPNLLDFDGLDFRLEDGDLVAIVTLSDSSGATKDHELRYRRVPH